MNKLELTKLIPFTLLAALLIWDAMQYLAGRQTTIPQSHKQLLGTTALLWFATLLFTNNRDDDWAGQW